LQIKINLQIFIFIIVFYFTHQIGIYAVLMTFIFLHEIGHIIAGMFLGLAPKSLHITPFGLTVVFEIFNKERIIEIKKIIIAIAGPLVNLIICIIAMFLGINEEIKQTIIYSNILIMVLNLIPIYPLDGGRIIKSVLKLKYNEILADDISNRMSNIITIFMTMVSSILIIYFRNIAILFILAYLWAIVVKGNKDYKLKKRMYEILNNDKNSIKKIPIE